MDWQECPTGAFVKTLQSLGTETYFLKDLRYTKKSSSHSVDDTRERNPIKHQNERGFWIKLGRTGKKPDTQSIQPGNEVFCLKSSITAQPYEVYLAFGECLHHRNFWKCFRPRYQQLKICVKVLDNPSLNAVKRRMPHMHCNCESCMKIISIFARQNKYPNQAIYVQFPCPQRGTKPGF